MRTPIVVPALCLVSCKNLVQECICVYQSQVFFPFQPSLWYF